MIAAWEGLPVANSEGDPCVYRVAVRRLIKRQTREELIAQVFAHGPAPESAAGWTTQLSEFRGLQLKRAEMIPVAYTGDGSASGRKRWKSVYLDGPLLVFGHRRWRRERRAF